MNRRTKNEWDKKNTKELSTMLRIALTVHGLSPLIKKQKLLGLSCLQKPPQI